MNILRLILKNLRHGSLSYKLPHTHECTSNRYRGLVQNDAARCVGCGACAYVCPTAAIVVKRQGDNYSWSYDPGKCTFCSRCIDRCRLKTLTIDSILPPIYSAPGELAQVLNMVRKRPAPRPAAAPATAPKAEGQALAAKSIELPKTATEPAV